MPAPPDHDALTLPRSQCALILSGLNTSISPSVISMIDCRWLHGRIRCIVMSLRDTYFTREVSEAIGMSRVICITFMMFVHVWPGATRIVAAETNPLLESFYDFVVGDLARASVPLLSIISGLLWWRSLRRGTSRVQLVRKKVVSLLVPMAVWSAALLILSIGYSWLIGDQQFWDKTWLGWINQVFAITDAPINLPLAFLRDIFLCGAILTVADAIFPRNKVFLLIALLLWLATELIFDGALLLRPQIAIFFSLGVVIAVISPSGIILPFWVVGAGILLDLAQRNYFPAETMHFGIPALDGLLHRLVVALVFWKISTELVRHGGRIKQVIHSAEDRIFLVFCSHMLTISAMSAVFGALDVRIDEISYLFIFLIQIPVIFATAEMIRIIGNQAAPIASTFRAASRPGK